VICCRYPKKYHPIPPDVHGTSPTNWDKKTREASSWRGFLYFSGTYRNILWCRGRNRTTTPATLDVELRYAVEDLQENFVRAVATVMLTFEAS
jgi:hypothetical protein